MTRYWLDWLKMVLIWRWPKASYSVSCTACMVTPRRMAASRSTSMRVTKPSVLLVAGDVVQVRAGPCRLREQAGRPGGSAPAASVSIRVYWNWVRLTRVPIWMSCTGCMNTVMPGMAKPMACWKRAITWGAASRSCRGLRAMVSGRCWASG